MKVIESYYGPRRQSHFPADRAYGMADYEAYLQVEIEGTRYHCQMLVPNPNFGAPHSVIERELQRRIMDKVAERLFGR